MVDRGLLKSSPIIVRSSQSSGTLAQLQKRQQSLAGAKTTIMARHELVQLFSTPDGSLPLSNVSGHDLRNIFSNKWLYNYIKGFSHIGTQFLKNL